MHGFRLNANPALEANIAQIIEVRSGAVVNFPAHIAEEGFRRTTCTEPAPRSLRNLGSVRSLFFSGQKNRTKDCTNLRAKRQGDQDGSKS
jgi:hypothetical protein